MKRGTVVVGLGNPLMADDGIGPYLLEKLSVIFRGHPDIDLVNGGTGGMSLLHIIANRAKVILIDCASMGTPPGTIRHFTPDDVASAKSLSHFTLHETDILNVLEISRQLGEYPHEVIIFGIEPVRIEMGQTLSHELLAHEHDYLDVISKEIRGGPVPVC
jgi:hydrogenase maturation protease